ncbi:hypothetical protein M406DRAFT_332954 [Cryphonectria parasitica EP155]|uniref:Uncharacterized protein n=1 Tax=Cryphonectria parasitica (strain ATCC 38755 / EP155) TaxID=660469 RepID=A0A9P4XWH6_CRYP1|nr:uncharacterized protein M406DRAFT_332954 [Cryphonectria parasitica EP155]KAF3762579.1 hypothetical protein M406DRAFT_332954 [Cryphonectria parasitica EP155]
MLGLWGLVEEDLGALWGFWVSGVVELRKSYPQKISFPQDGSRSEKAEGPVNKSIEAKPCPSGAEWDWYDNLDTDRLINFFAIYRLVTRSQSPSLYSEDGSIATEPQTGPGLNVHVHVHHDSSSPIRAKPSFESTDTLSSDSFPPRPNAAWALGQDRRAEVMEQLALYTSSLKLSASQEAASGVPTVQSAADTLSECEAESPLFSSIRRVLSADPSYSAEAIISAIKEQSADESRLLSSANQLVDDHPISNELSSPREVPSGQQSTSKKRSAGQTGRQSSSANKKSKTSVPPNGDDDGDGAGDDGSGSGGGGRDDKDNRGDRNSGQQASRPEVSQGWKCPYCHRYGDITFQMKFRSCGRPGFRGRDDFWTHLWKTHSPEAKPQDREDLARYYMDQKQQDDLKLLMINTKRVAQSDRVRWLKVQLDLYRKVWAILFPESKHIPDSPFHVKYDKLREHCLTVVKTLMEVDVAQSTEAASAGKDDYRLSRQKVEQMLVIALHVGLDAHPGAAEVFGGHIPEQREVTATNRPSQATEQPANAQQILENPLKDPAVARGDDEIAAPPVNPPERRREAASLQQQELPAQAGSVAQTGPPMGRYKTQVPLYNNGENKIVIQMKPKGPPEPDQRQGSLLSAQLQIIAPLAFEPKITAPKPSWTREILNPTPPPSMTVNQGGIAIPPTASAAIPPPREQQLLHNPNQNIERFGEPIY